MSSSWFCFLLSFQNKKPLLTNKKRLIIVMDSLLIFKQIATGIGTVL
jgi:hypothetical protein